ncbi:unnamed protein product, partial [Oikopleura dioica]
RVKAEAPKSTNAKSSSPMTANGRIRRPGIENKPAENNSPKIENPYDSDNRTNQSVRINDRRSSQRGYKDAGSGFNRGHAAYKEPARQPESGQKAEEAYEEYTFYPIPEGVLMIGDSMLKCCMDYMDNIPLNDFFLFAYPGIRAEGLAAEMKSEYLPPPRRVGTVILHVGTNNASQSREKSTVDDCAREIIKCIHMLRKLYPAALIFVSSILPRLDEENSRAVECNKIVAVYVNTELQNDDDIRVLDFSPDFYIENNGKIKECFYRNSEQQNKPTEDGKESYKDTVHLSAEGGKHFTDLLHYCLRAAKHENENRRESYGFMLPTRVDWLKFRKSEIGKFEKQRRHRETNYIAAQKKSYKFDQLKKDERRSPNREENNDEAENKTPAESTEGFYNNGTGSQECPYDEDEDSIASTFSANKQIIDWDNKDEFEFDYDGDDMFAQANKKRDKKTPDESESTCEDDSNDGSSNNEKPLCAQVKGLRLWPKLLGRPYRRRSTLKNIN